jgi:hydroxymethylpyrimidine/phosphomethylpyrimidine kinase
VQADLKTISALGGYGLNVITSVVSEVPGLVSRIELMPGDFIEDQLRVLGAAFPIGAMKTGMLGGLEQVRAVIAGLGGEALRHVPLVVDPVMVATSGRRLLTEEAIATIKAELLPRARLITPNMDEAEVLWGRPVRSREAMAQCATELASHYHCAVLVKGGHLLAEAAADVLCDGQQLHWYESARILGVHTHGTGCTYSAAIATGLAKGLALVDAVAEAKRYISRAIEDFFEWKTLQGAVHALNHFAK